MNRRWLAFGAAVLAIAVFGTAGAVSDQKSGPFKDKAKKRASADFPGRGFAFGHLKDKRGGPGAEDAKPGRFSALPVLMGDDAARAAIGSAIAKTLGSSVEEVRAALKDDSKDLDDLMKAAGVSEAKLGAAVAAAAKPHLDRLVKAGTIERAAADDLLTRLEDGAWIGKLAHLSGLTGG
jgi:hypothetical protein